MPKTGTRLPCHDRDWRDLMQAALDDISKEMAGLQPGVAKMRAKAEEQDPDRKVQPPSPQALCIVHAERVCSEAAVKLCQTPHMRVRSSLGSGPGPDSR